MPRIITYTSYITHYWQQEDGHQDNRERLDRSLKRAAEVTNQDLVASQLIGNVAKQNRYGIGN